MQEKINKQKSLPESLFWVSLGLGLVFLIVDTVLTVITSRDQSFAHAYRRRYQSFLGTIDCAMFFRHVCFSCPVYRQKATRRGGET